MISTILRFLEFLSLGAWVGGILYLSFAIAPGAFAAVGSRDQAGAVVGMALGRLHILGWTAGALFLAARVLSLRSFSALLRPAALLVILMLALTVLSQQWVAPQMARLRQQMGSVERAPEDSPLRGQFNRLHRFSVRLEAFVLLAGLAAFFLVVRETMR